VVVVVLLLLLLLLWIGKRDRRSVGARFDGLDSKLLLPIQLMGSDTRATQKMRAAL
jgi:hypothetical protein